jgi:uncharacterized protein (TIGR03000 family)
VIVQPDKKMEKAPPPKKESALPNQATVVVEAPADVQVYVEGQLLSRAATTDSFVTPELEMGKNYSYTMKAVAVRDGQTVSQTKRVLFRAGQEAKVDFRDLAVPTSGAVAKVTVNLPKDAKLFVDGVECLVTSDNVSFDTPKLETGRTYTYTLQAEVVRAGQKRSESKRVEFQAGNEVNVQFTLAATQAASR